MMDGCLANLPQKTKFVCCVKTQWMDERIFIDRQQRAINQNTQTNKNKSQQLDQVTPFTKKKKKKKKKNNLDQLTSLSVKEKHQLTSLSVRRKKTHTHTHKPPLQSNRKPIFPPRVTSQIMNINRDEIWPRV